MGKTSTHVFTSKQINPYGDSKLVGSAINFELGNVHHFFDARIYADFTSNSQVNFSFGYGYNIYFEFVETSNKMTEKIFILKPSLNIGFSQYRSGRDNKTDNFFGSIDNEDKILNFLRYTSSPTFTYTTHKPLRTYVENTKEVDFLFAQNDWTIIPKISLSNNQYLNTFHWEINIGYSIPFYEKGGLQIFQNGWHSIKSPSVHGFGENGLVTTFNQKVITQSPYSFSGIFIFATVGMNISKRLFEKLDDKKRKYKKRSLY